MTTREINPPLQTSGSRANWRQWGSDSDALLIASDFDGSDARMLRRMHHDGGVVKLRRGAWVNSAQWALFAAHAQHLERVRAELRLRQRAYIVSHGSAALLWGYTVMREAEMAVHLLCPSATSAASTGEVRLHREHCGPDEVTERHGLDVTTPVRTLVDIARTASFADAVVTLDSALRTRRLPSQRDGDRPVIQHEALSEALDARPAAKGRARAARAIAFAEAGSDSVGESLSRIALAELGFAAPLLQVRHRNPAGGSYYTDFEWPEAHVIGEFDGRSKYLREELRHGMSAGEAVYAEKVREDDLRAEGNTVVRWGMADAVSPARLAGRLVAAGVPANPRKGIKRTFGRGVPSPFVR